MNLHEIGNNFLSFKARIAMIFNKRVHIEGSNYLKNSLDRPPILIIYSTISLRQLFKRENQEPFGHVQVQNNNKILYIIELIILGLLVFYKC